MISNALTSYIGGITERTEYQSDGVYSLSYRPKQSLGGGDLGRGCADTSVGFRSAEARAYFILMVEMEEQCQHFVWLLGMAEETLRKIEEKREKRRAARRKRLGLE